MNGKNARVVAIAFLDEDIEGPEAGLDDRVAGRAVPDHRCANEVFDRSLCVPDVLPKLLRRQHEHELMVITMRCHFVARGRDLTHERRKALSDPAENEERRAHARAREKLQQPIRISRHAAVELIPSGPRRDAVERGHLEIILDVHAHRVHDAGARSRLDGTGGAHRAPLRSTTVLIVSMMMTRSSAIERFLM